MAKKAARPRDTNQIAKRIVDIATNEEEKVSNEKSTSEEIKAAAAALGRLGGLKGGKARAKKLSANKRSEIAKKAASARWKK
ncbi:MAG TPA: hypothetical protein VGQ53_06655 [Chitinophagaceae bacterium]|nr:hypothetical protein [Chitinophagaceae bacterium]